MSSNLVITDEEFNCARSSLYSSAYSKIEKVAKMILNVTDNLAAIGSKMTKTEDEIFNVIEKSDILVDDSGVNPEQTMDTTSSNEN